MKTDERMVTLLKKCGQLYDQPFTLVAANLKDQPLIFVNQAFRDLVQYKDREILGRNCRFLQGPLTDKVATKQLRYAIAQEQPVYRDILNYKKDGSTFWNRLVLLPIKIGGTLFYFGLQHDVTEKMETKGKSVESSGAEEASDWIKNRLNFVILSMELSEKKTEPEVLRKINATLKLISEFVWSLK